MNWAVIELMLVWFTFWAGYNFVLLPRKISTERSPKLMSSVYAVVSLLIWVISPFSNVLLLVGTWLLLVVINLLFKNKILARMSNSLFQMSWILALSVATGGNMLLVALLFWFGHWPVLLLGHLAKISNLILLTASGLGGLVLVVIAMGVISPYSLIPMILIHLVFYESIRSYDKKYKWGIIN